MTEAQIRSVALFFYFTLLDEELAEKACRHTIDKCRKRLKKQNASSSDVDTIIIHHMHSAFEQIRVHHILNKASLSPKAHYITPAGISFGAWRQFHKEAAPEDLISVVLANILSFEDSIIAVGLGVTIGSVRYRVGRGLRQLGHLITLGEIIA